MMTTLTPAYGRDYKSSKEAKQDYLSGLDFILNDVSSPYNGKYCSCRDFVGEFVTLRYHRLSRMTTATFNELNDARYTGENDE